MKMMCLRKDKSSQPIGLFDTPDLANIMAKRLDLGTFEIVPVEVKFRDLEPHEVHGNIEDKEIV
jgi:hypothetical protein